jgi:hypothetical protein
MAEETVLQLGHVLHPQVLQVRTNELSKVPQMSGCVFSTSFLLSLDFVLNIRQGQKSRSTCRTFSNLFYPRSDVPSKIFQTVLCELNLIGIHPSFSCFSLHSLLR